MHKAHYSEHAYSHTWTHTHTDTHTNTHTHTHGQTDTHTNTQKQQKHGHITDSVLLSLSSAHTHMHRLNGCLMLSHNLCIPHKSDLGLDLKWEEKESQDDKIKISQKRADTWWYYFAQRQCSINSLAFIFLGYCEIQWIRPAREKQRASKQAPSSVHSQKMLW